MDEKPNIQPGIQSETDQKKWQNVIDEIWNNSNSSSWKIGKGTVVKLPYLENDFVSIGITQDIYFPNLNRADSETISWTHRKADNEEVYFLSNQKAEKRTFDASFRITGIVPQWYNPVTDKTSPLANWKIENGRTIVFLTLEANESGFVIFKEETKAILAQGKTVEFEKVQANIDALQHGTELDSQWVLDASKAQRKSLADKNDWRASGLQISRILAGDVLHFRQGQWQGLLGCEARPTDSRLIDQAAYQALPGLVWHSPSLQHAACQRSDGQWHYINLPMQAEVKL